MSEDLLEQLRRNIMTRSEPSDELMAKAADSIEKLEGELKSERARVDFLRGEVERLDKENELQRKYIAEGAPGK